MITRPAGAPIFRAAPKSTASDHITMEIEAAVSRGDLRPGERFRLKDLAKQFNVSVIPVREALNRLAARGLVQRGSDRGMFVVELSLEELGAILEVRLPLEGLAARLATSRATLEEFTALRRTVVGMTQALARRDQLHYSECDLEFHQRLWSCARNPFLERCLKSIMLPWFGYQIAKGVLSLEEDWGQIPGLHAQIIDAMESGYADKAEQSVRDLTSCVKNYITHEAQQ